MRHFKQVFGEVMDFVLVDAPFECHDSPLPGTSRFANYEGAKFRAWLMFYEHLSQEDKSVITPDIVSGLEKSVEFLINVIKT